jgi:hypothetical protein
LSVWRFESIYVRMVLSCWSVKQVGLCIKIVVFLLGRVGGRSL